MKNKSSYLILAFAFLFITTNLFAEKWVGQAATYQLRNGVAVADGSIYNKEKLSAASNCFKLGTVVRVTNSQNGKSVDLLINDRINNESNYFILLTPKAAKTIDIEWQTSIVIVQANFNDINTDEIYKVNGLIPENQIDPDSLKEFPDIQWPENIDEKENDDFPNEIPDFVKDLLDEEDEKEETQPENSDLFEDEPEFEDIEEVEEPIEEPEFENIEEIEEPEEYLIEEPEEIEEIKIKDETSDIQPEIIEEIDETSDLQPEIIEEIIEDTTDEVVETIIYPNIETQTEPKQQTLFVDVMEDERLKIDRPDIDNELCPTRHYNSVISDENETTVVKFYPQLENDISLPTKQFIVTDIEDDFANIPHFTPEIEHNNLIPDNSTDFICEEDFAEIEYFYPKEETTDYLDLTTDKISEDDIFANIDNRYPTEESAYYPDLTNDKISEDDIFANIDNRYPTDQTADYPDLTTDMISEDDFICEIYNLLPEQEFVLYPDITSDLISSDDAVKISIEKVYIPDLTDDSKVSDINEYYEEEISPEQEIIADLSEDNNEFISEDDELAIVYNQPEKEEFIEPTEEEYLDDESLEDFIYPSDETDDVARIEEEIEIEEEQSFDEVEEIIIPEDTTDDFAPIIEEVEEYIIPEDDTDDITPSEEETLVEEDEAEEHIEKTTDDVVEEEPESKEDEFNLIYELEANKIYVRFMTTYDTNEAKRMYNNFKKIIGEITLLYQEDKYILLCGPFDSDSDEAFNALNDLQTMGFSDAYLVTK